MRSYPVEPERPNEYELNPRRSRGYRCRNPAQSRAHPARREPTRVHARQIQLRSSPSVCVKLRRHSGNFLSLLSRTLGVRGGRWDCAHARVCRVTRGATKSPHVSDDKHTGGDAVARGSPGRRAGGFRERGVLAGPHGAVPARTNARGRWGQGWGQGRLRRSRELVLRVQHLPRAGFGPRRDAVRAPLLLALHIQVSIRRGTSGIFSHARPTFPVFAISRSQPSARGFDPVLTDSSPASRSNRWLQVFPEAQQCPVCKAGLSEELVRPPPRAPRIQIKTFTLNLIFASDQIDRSITA